MQVYASSPFDATIPMKPAVHSWDFACVPRVLNVVTEMAVALRAIGVKCNVHHVAEKDVQQIVKVGPSMPQECKEQQSVLQSQQPAAVFSAAARATQERALQVVLVAVRHRWTRVATNKPFVPYECCYLLDSAIWRKLCLCCVWFFQ